MFWLEAFVRVLHEVKQVVLIVVFFLIPRQLCGKKKVDSKIVDR